MRRHEGGENCITNKGGNRLTVFENRVLRIFGPKKDKVKGG
jgi:hypothetical protein